MTSSAPKFASFRPKPKAPEPEQSLPEKARQEEKRPKQHQTSRESKREDRRPPQPGKWKHDRDASPKKAYFSDRRGDSDIVKYGTLNSYDVPSYRRCGFGSVMGLPWQKIDREYSTEKKICMTPLVRPRQKRLLTDKHAAREGRRTLRLVKLAQISQPDAELDFITLSSTRKRKRDSDVESSQEDDGATEVDYRGLHEKRDPGKADDPDTYYGSDTDTSITNSEVLKKNSELVRATRDNPQNLHAWLDLIAHQEPMMRLDRITAELSASDKQNLADIRISTYEEALRRIGDNEASRIELQTRLLQEARRHWDDAKLAAKWSDVLQTNPHSIPLWFGYLDFVQSTFATFKYEDCRAIYCRAIEVLQSTSSTDTASTDDSATSTAKLHLFVRLTRMIQDAGYQELSLAIWQAVLEFSLLAPPDLGVERLQRFEEFWESEAPRIGEPDSKGWKHMSIDDAVPPECSINLDASGTSKDVLEDFKRREVEFTNKLRYPGRSTDDVGEDDPFHTIFFSDIKQYLEMIPTVAIESLLDAFLCFCGLPGLISTGSGFAWRADPFLRTAESQPILANEKQAGGLQYQEALERYLQSPITSFRMTSDILVQQSFTLAASRLSPDFIRNILKILAANTPQSEFIGEYLLAFEYKYFPTDVAKTARRLLKARPSSPRLYNMYGLIEGCLGNLLKADQVFGAALKLADAPPADSMQLLQSHAWQSLIDNDVGGALRRLVAYGRKWTGNHMTQPDPGEIKLTAAGFRDLLEDALLRMDYVCAVVYTCLLALLTYLSSDCDAGAALGVHHNLTSWFISHRLSASIHAEIHAQAIARLLSYHVTHASTAKPALIRTALEPLIATFPSNTFLLSTFAANEARFSIEDRVRGNMHRVLDTSPSSTVATWAFAIHHETLKGQLAGSTSHSIRALYKRATDPGSSGAHCPALWHMYLRFELEQLHREQRLRPNNRPRRDAKKGKWESRVEQAQDSTRSVFYQGLRRLPWCKDFLLRAFTDARDLFGGEELRTLCRLMMEKELRVYTDLEEPDMA